jgi:hypothetical protein
MKRPGDSFQAAALAYLGYGVVYWVGGLYLIAQGVGVAGERTSSATGASMAMWGALGLVPLLVIPLLLWRPWSWWGGWLSRRTFAWLVAALLAARAVKVGAVAFRGGASVAAPWGGEITFQTGAAIFLVVTVVAFVFVIRAAILGTAR